MPYLLFISSQSVYGTNQPPPWHEETPLQPATPYAHSKAAAEAVIQTLQGSATRWAILRLARLYGLSPCTRWGELAHRFAFLTAEGKALSIFGEGEQRIDLLHVRDAAASVASIIMRGSEAWDQIYNIGGGRPISINELAAACTLTARAAGLRPPLIVHKALDTQAPSFGMSIERARSEIGWSPHTRLEDGLTELIAHAGEETAHP